jgi:hypothetical protein
MTRFTPDSNSPLVVHGRLKLNRQFQPCTAEPDDELYLNGIFEFNITRLLAFIDTQPQQWAPQSVELAQIPQHGDDSHLDPDAIAAADLSRPILLAEISPGLYNVIDGNHRLTKARREAARTILARRIRCPQHVSFLTSMTAYEAYVEYWNSKVGALQSYPTRTRRRKRTLQ